MVGEIEGPMCHVTTRDESPVHVFLDLPNGLLSQEAGNLLADVDGLIQAVRKMEQEDQERLVDKVDHVRPPDYRSCSPFIFSHRMYTRRLSLRTCETPSPWSVLEACAAQ